MKTTSIELPYPAGSGNHSVRHTRSGGHYLTAGTLAYRLAVKAAVGLARAPDGPIQADWVISPPDRRARDFDNLMKVVKDALTLAGFWGDDSNRVIRGGSWVWCEPTKGGAITLTCAVTI